MINSESQYWEDRTIDTLREDADQVIAIQMELAALKIQKGETLADFVERRIRAIFSEIAEMVAASDDQPDSAPLEIFQAEGVLLKAWREFTNDS